ncbi:ASPARTIC PROTEINASE PCS1 [Salix koriyanagi]|uniref:ASPARTIC PROTEINASE PCS1 n=1 Tax=Salix koriyanagi TaxID=2511006 RepID=A0A9Q0ZUA8_9ROSI|nr:ASPARTIC PROTEINASE PCS1 [Salix koriyanagi]
MSPWSSTLEVSSPGFTATKHYPTRLHSTRTDPHLTKPFLVLHPSALTGPRTSLYQLHVTPITFVTPPFLMLTPLPPMEIWRPMFSTLEAPIFPVWSLGCMDSVFSSNTDEDSKNTGLMGMNRGSLSFVSQLGFLKFSYCISGTDFSGLLLLGESNLTWSVPLNYTPLIQISAPLPYFDRVAYTVQLEGIKVLDRLLPIPKSTFEPDHTGAGQTMVDSGTQFTFLLGPAYTALRTAFLNQTDSVLKVLDDPDFVFQGAMDLCYLVPLSQRVLPQLPTVTLVFHGAEMTVSGDKVLYRVPGELRGNDSVHCLSFGNSDLLGVEAYVIGHHHQQNVWMEFDLEKSRIGLAQVRCDLAGQRYGVAL